MRLGHGGLIDRSRPLTFRFDGTAIAGFEGDTIASALLASGRRLVARGFKYHRPRGILSAGVEEPNAILRVGEDAIAEPNVRATMVALSDGMVARSQNAWPSVALDLGAGIELFSRFLGAGFYYKTFLWPPRAWRFYEKLIRRAAGLGPPPEGADPRRHESRHAHCDVLVIGGGPAGLAAATAAAACGARVVLCEQDRLLGGQLCFETATIGDSAAWEWASRTASRLAAAENVDVLANTTAFARHDGNLVLLEETLSPNPGTAGGLPARRLWKLRAKTIVLASGAIEKPLVFPGNDRPAIMLASAARAYIRRFAVRPGRRAVIVTNNDSAYATIGDLAHAGIEIAAVVDLRGATDRAARRCAEAGARYLPDSRIAATHGRRGVKAVDVVAARGDGGARRRISCDLLCMSGGWSPTVHLYAQHRGALHYDNRLAALVPDNRSDPVFVAGAASGDFALADCIAQGRGAGLSAAAACGFDRAPTTPPATVMAGEWLCRDASATTPTELLLAARQKSFVDFQNDVTVSDLALACREGFASIEHVKRYTTLGMGTDQGKTSNANAIAIVAELTGAPASDIQHTTFRPPYVPVSLGAIAAEATGQRLAPTRRSAFHDASASDDVTVVTSGDWLYPRYYARSGETMARAVDREVLNTRRRVGMVDMSTLGKADVQGRDALTFLERVYCNNLSRVAVGKLRYSLMLREDGIVLDDGTVSRLGEHHYLLTMTTANSWRVWLHLEKLRQAHWPELDVKLASVTDHWASLAIAGPEARNLLSRLEPDFDIANDAFPFASVREGRVAGLPARVFRVSFCGELGYEINVPAGYAEMLWRGLREQGRDLGLAPYGLEALDVMRIEKGHVSAGTEIDGRTTPGDLGMDRMVSGTKDFIGRALLDRPALSADGRRQFVGLVPADGATPIPLGAQITRAPWRGKPQSTMGHVTAAITSPTLGHPVALALIEDGHSRMGEKVWAVSPVARSSVEAVIARPAFYDPEGERLHG